MISDGALSQDEIEALLQGADDAFAGGGFEPALSSGGGSGGKLSESQKATFLEIVRVMLENHAFSLSSISTKTASITEPSLTLGGVNELRSMVSSPAIEARVTYSGKASGNAYYYMPRAEAGKIAGLMMGQDDGELSEMGLQALTEAYSQMSGAADSALTDKYGADFSSASPSLTEKASADQISPSNADLAIVKAKLNMEDVAADATYVIAFELGLVNGFLNAVTGAKSGGASSSDMSLGGATDFDSLLAGAPSMGNLGVNQADFAALAPAAEVQPTGNMGLLMDVTMRLTVELGRTTMTIRDILALGEGSIIELDKLAGEPVDLLVNNKLIAKGEVVVIDENFGVRVTEIADPHERVSNKNQI